MAPEILELGQLKDTTPPHSTPKEIPHGTIQSDTFAAGCVFFNFLTRGKHPFGNILEIPMNILNNNPNELNKHIANLQGDDRALYELIGNMIKPLVIREGRITLPEVIEQLTAELDASRKFKRVVRIVGGGVGKCVVRFHPKEPLIACAVEDEITFFSAENSSIPFSNWKKDENKFQIGHLKEITTMEWKADGTQLATIFNKDEIVCWSYPSGAILFQIKTNLLLKEGMDRIEWNPFRPNLFVTFHPKSFEKFVFFFDSCPVDQRSFHFCTIECGRGFESVQWISANRVAFGFHGGWGEGEIAIWEIDESTTSAKTVKRFIHKDGLALDVAWNERTKYLAACPKDGLATIWSMDSDQPIHTTKVEGINRKCRCWSLAWRPNGKQTDDEGVEAARKSADNFILACGLSYGQILIWTPLDSKEKTKILISQHSDWVEWLSFSPDGRFLASAVMREKLIIWATENWEPLYIGEEEIRWGDRFSWLSSSSDVHACKLTFDSSDGKVVVVEYAVGQSEEPSKNGSKIP